MKSPTKNLKPAAPLRIDGPGTYLTRDGRTVEVTARDDDQYPWLATYEDDGFMFHRPNGRSQAYADDYDIIAPAKPAPVKKARRRYVVRAMRGDLGWCVFDREGNPHGPYLALEMSRADARAFCRMKEAQRGGASTTSMRKSSK